MTLKEYLDELNKLAKEHPEALEFLVYYARDDEGNGFQQVTNTAQLAYSQEVNKYAIEELDFSERDREIKPNLICIN